MNTIYLLSLAIGGVLLMITLFGGDNDTDADADFDGDFDADADADGGDFGDAGALLAWLPFGSIRFWIFFLAFFGLTGATLIVVSGTDSPATQLPIALGVGYFAGMLVVRVIRSLSRKSTTSIVSPTDYLGTTVKVTSAVRGTQLGRVSFETKGQVVEVLARAQEGEVFEVGQQALLYQVDDAGNATITRADDSANDKSEAPLPLN